jgi:hypothetical protein
MVLAWQAQCAGFNPRTEINKQKKQININSSSLMNIQIVCFTLVEFLGFVSFKELIYFIQIAKFVSIEFP